MINQPVKVSPQPQNLLTFHLQLEVNIDLSSKSYFYVNFQILSNIKEDCRSFHPGVYRKQDWSNEEADLVILASPSFVNGNKQPVLRIVILFIRFRRFLYKK